MIKITASLMTLIGLMLLTACQAEPKLLGTWVAQHEKEDLTLVIHADGSCVATDQKQGRPARDPIPGQWQANQDGSYRLNIQKKQFKAELISDDELKLITADDEAVIFKRQ